MGDCRYVDSKKNISKTKKRVTFVGVNDLCVIEDGDEIVVAKRDRVEQIKYAAKLEKL